MNTKHKASIREAQIIPQGSDSKEFLHAVSLCATQASQEPRHQGAPTNDLGALESSLLFCYSLTCNGLGALSCTFKMALKMGALQNPYFEAWCACMWMHIKCTHIFDWAHSSQSVNPCCTFKMALKMGALQNPYFEAWCACMWMHIKCTHIFDWAHSSQSVNPWYQGCSHI